MLLHGQPIQANEIETTTSRWSPRDFASFCNTLTWAVSGSKSSGIPSFTERINVVDKGIDSEWDCNISNDQGEAPNPLLVKGWNVHQYKQRDIFARNRDQIFSDLKNKNGPLYAAVKKLYDKTEKRPRCYVLFVNLDLVHEQKHILKDLILAKYDKPEETSVQIVGAGELAAMVNDAPHLRSAFFASVSFATWQRAWERHSLHKQFGADLPLIGRTDELERLKSLVDDESVKVIILSGPHDIGKTRLVLEATRHRHHEVVLALDPRSLSSADLTFLESNKMQAVVLIEDPDIYRVQSIVTETLSTKSLRAMITLPTPQNACLPSYGQDTRIIVLSLGPLSHANAEELLKSTKRPMDYGVFSWIIHQANGNPGILLAASSVALNLHESAGDFVRQVGAQFENRILAELGEKSLSVLKLLSVLDHVGISGPFSQELQIVCEMLGESLTTNEVLTIIPRLESNGVISLGGSFAGVAMPILGSYLCEKVLRGRENEILMLFSRLDGSGQVRFLKRLRTLRLEEAKRFWDEMFGSSGLFQDIDSLLQNIHTLHLIAGAVPTRVLSVLEARVLPLSKQDRLSIAGETRRELIWTVEQLLFRKSTCEGAIRILSSLAEAENETWGNNATGLFIECFHPLHPQIPIKLDVRLGILKDLAAEENSLEKRLLAVQAARSALEHPGGHFLRESDGSEPFDGMPPMTYGEIWDYMISVVDLLIGLAKSPEKHLGIQACNALPGAVGECMIHARTDEAIKRMKTLVEWAKEENPIIDISDLAESVNRVRRVYSDMLQKGNVSPEVKDKYSKILDEMNEIRKSLEEGDFALHLKRWAGKWTIEDDDLTEIDGQRRYRYLNELEALAKEAIESPSILTDPILHWLCQPDAQKAWNFFLFLGKNDVSKSLLQRIESLAKKAEGGGAFATYCQGISSHDAEEIVQRLEKLNETGDIHPDAVVMATASMPANEAAVNRIRGLIETGKVNPSFTERMLVGGRWIQALTDGQFLTLVKAIAGPSYEYDYAVIDIMGMWMHLGRKIEGDLAGFAWSCLEACRPIRNRNDAWHYDRLAEKLATNNPERGYFLLEKLLQKEHDEKCWNPIDRFGSRKFWHVLLKSDRRRALSLVLDLCRLNPIYRFRLTWNLKEALNQVEDQDLLIDLALQNEENAEIISECINTRQDGFWPIAIKIVEKYPGNQRILSGLTSGIEQLGFVFTGEESLHLEKCRDNIENILKNRLLPTSVRKWLEGLYDAFVQAIRKKLVVEYDENVSNFRSHLESQNSSLRDWALERILKNMDWGDIKKRLKKQEIQETLPRLNLSQELKDKVSRLLKSW